MSSQVWYFYSDISAAGNRIKLREICCKHKKELPMFFRNNWLNIMTANPEIVFVLGAGASKDAGYPLIQDFLSPEYIDNSLSVLEKEGILSRRETRLTRNYLILECQYFKKEGSDLEQILINYETLGSQDKIDRLLEYYYSLFDVGRTVGGIIDKSAYMEDLAEILRAYGKKACVISFNHDNLLEYEIKMQDDKFYKIPFLKMFESLNYGFNKNEVVNLFPNSPGMAPSSIQLRGKIMFLKLHGSLNWSMCDKCGIIGHSPEALVGFYGDQTIIEQYKNLNCPRCQGKMSKPLIIPPIRVKNIGVLMRLWERAEKALQYASRVYIIGYSLPCYDEDAKRLLNSGLNKGNSKRVLIINKRINNNLISNYKSIFEDPIFIEISFRDYIKVYWRNNTW